MGVAGSWQEPRSVSNRGLPGSARSLDADVVVVGGGPCGLVMAHELGRRGIRTMLFNERPDTTPYPAAGATQARTMEHYRRLGLSEKVRAAGLPPSYPTDVAYFTRFAATELSRFELPASRDAGELIQTMTGSWSAAELPHRCAQMYVERILREGAEQLPSVSLQFGWKVTGFTDHGDHVAVEVASPGGEIVSRTASYLVAADGARSGVRKALDTVYEGERMVDRPFLAGQMYATYFRSAAVYDLIPHRRAWQYWAINPERRGMILSLNGRDEFVHTTQLRPGELPEQLSDAAVRELIHSAMGQSFELEIIARSPWTAGLTLVAERFQAGRAFMGGDAVHLFTPTGGLGYNTAVEDAVNLGWKLAATVKGWGGPRLLESYEAERKPVAKRNTGYARAFAESLGRFAVPAEIEDDNEKGAAERQAVGEYLLRHARAEFNIPGVTFGARYDGSPVIVSDGTEPPPDSAGVYQPTACPGGRAPHTWLADGRSLYDALSFEFTLLLLGGAADGGAPIVAAADARGVPLTVLDLIAEGLRDLYEADLAIVRPDQIVCWRGDGFSGDPDELLDLITGYGAAA